MKPKFVDIEDVLSEEQKYVADARVKFGIEMYGVLHNISTDTCFEKAELLGWDPKRVVKAVYLSGGDNVYGFVFPELGLKSPFYINSKEVLPKVLKISKNQAKRFTNGYSPKGMELGTCTPFFFKGDNIEKIFLYDAPFLEGKFVDISIGGKGEEAHKKSVHIKYDDMYKILKNEFKERIEKVDFGFEKV